MAGLLPRLAMLWFHATFCAQIWAWGLVLAGLWAAWWTRALCTLYLSYFAYNVLGPGKRDATSGRGARKWPAPLRHWSLWRHLAAYFPASLIRTQQLDPKKNYIFVMQPHGLCAISGWVSFATEATGFSRLFPGLRVHCVTLDSNFRTPLLREYILMHGLRSASRRSLLNILSAGPGSSVLLVVGGASESLVSHPHTYDVLVGKRRGFVQVAMETGASLVPVLAFGETNTFNTYIPREGSRLHRAMRSIKAACGFAVPLFWGTNLLGGRGLCALRTPLDTVVGAPIEVPKFTGDRDSEAGKRMANEVHQAFCTALQRLWDAHKDTYARDRASELRILSE